MRVNKFCYPPVSEFLQHNLLDSMLTMLTCVAAASLGLRAPSWGTDTKVDDEPESPTRVGITPPAVFSPLLSPRKQHVAHTLRPRTAPPLSAAMGQAGETRIHL